MRRGVAIIAVILIALGLVASVGVVAGEDDPPGEPQSFFGTVEQEDGVPAPEGVELFAMVDNEVEDSITVDPAGQYGGDGAFDEKLVVNTGAGDQVEFRAFSPDGPRSLDSPFEIDEFESEPAELDLNFEDGTFEESFDITITDLPAEVTEGDDVTVDYTVENTGVAEGTQNILFSVNDEQIDEESAVTLDGGDVFSGSFTYTTQTGDAPAVTIMIATADDTAEQTVSVQEPPLESVTLDLDETTINTGDTTHATVTAAYEDGSALNVTDQANITSLDPSIATVDGATVTGESGGSAVIEAAFTDTGVTETDSVTLDVEDPTPAPSPPPAPPDDDPVPEVIPEDEIADVIDVPADVEPTRGERVRSVFDAEGGVSTATFTDDSAVESVTINAEIEDTTTVAEYDQEPADIGPSPGASVTVTQVGVPDGFASTSGSIVKRIPVDRIEEEDISADDLRINRFVDGEFQGLDTEILSETDTHIRISADTPGFSFFTTSGVSEPDARFTMTPVEPEAGEEITLNATNSSDQYGEITSYEWMIEGQELTGETVTHTFDEPGEYMINLTVENDAGETSEQGMLVTVSEPTDDDAQALGFVPAIAAIGLLIVSYLVYHRRTE